MTGEELLCLVWLFLGFLFLVYAVYYIRQQRMISRFSKFVDALRKLVWEMERIEWPKWDARKDCSH